MSEPESAEDLRTPEECRSMAEIREVIDALDREIVRLVARRGRYVESAARFKKTVDDVHAEERQRRMLVERREWAAREGVDPELVDELFRNLVQRFVEMELMRFEERRR